MSAYFFVRKCEGTAGHAQNQYPVHLMMNWVTEGLLERDSEITFAPQQHTAWTNCNIEKMLERNREDQLCATNLTATDSSSIK